MNEFNQSESIKLVREVIALGKKYSKTSFPNPAREGCPGRSSLRAMAYRDQQLNLNDLPVSHVVSCSPCFREYVHFRRMSVLLRGIQVTAASLVALAVLFAAVRFIWSYTGERSEPNISREKRTEHQPLVATEQPPPRTAAVPIRVDLATFSPTRGDDTEGTSGNRVTLPRKLLRVNILLPLGMEPGEYALRLQDSKGIIFADTRAVGRMNDGITSVEVDLDLGSSPGGYSSMMIRPPGLGWRRYPVVVE